MLILVVGITIIAVPIALALRTLLRVTKRLGGVDAIWIGTWISEHPARDLAAVANALQRLSPGSISERLLTAVAEKHDSALAQQLALAEAVADIERDVADDVRVPRVAASLATTSGLLAASLVMREGLASRWEGGVAVPISLSWRRQSSRRSLRTPSYSGSSEKSSAMRANAYSAATWRRRRLGISSEATGKFS